MADTTVGKSWSQNWYAVLSRRKQVEETGTEATKLARVLGLVDLTALGIGSTLGLGVYVLAGAVAFNQAGPAVTLSFLIAALASAFAGVCYAEFASRVPRAGSAYVYSYVTVGEFCAFIIGWNLILEYAIGIAGVAKGTSNYVDALLDDALKRTFEKIQFNVSFLAPYPDFFSAGIVFILTGLLAYGVKESSNVNGIFTIVNLITVTIVIVCGLFKANASYWSIPKSEIPKDKKGGEGGFLPFGVAGVWAGAAKCFFGFVGFDVIATTGDEAKNPKRNIPLAILISLIIIFFAYFGVATVITMMIPYYDQDPDAPLPLAFKTVGLTSIMWIVSIGAICALCTSMLGSIYPLPRILFAMAEDGLLFECFSYVHPKTQTPLTATILSGLLAGIVSGIFNLTQLIDMMSIGTLLAYIIVAFCILILRYGKDTEIVKQPSLVYKNTSEKPSSVGSVMKALRELFNLNGAKHSSEETERVAVRAIVSFCISAALACFCFIYLHRYIPNYYICFFINLFFLILTVLSFVILARQPQSNKPVLFMVPLVPLIPCCSIVMNIYLMLELDIHTWIRFIFWLIIGLLIYVFYSLRHSVQGRRERENELQVRKVKGDEEPK